MRKSFEKQTKTIEDQGEKQIEAIKDNKKELDNINASCYKTELLLSKERKMFKNIYNGRLNRTEVLTKKIIMTLLFKVVVLN